jgi:pyruvate formate lyase activating enzyme
MATCKKCGRVSEETAKVLSLCAECVRKADNRHLGEIQEVHARSRERFGLAASPPSGPEGVQCTLCQNKCKIPVGGRGYCGVRAGLLRCAEK